MEKFMNRRLKSSMQTLSGVAVPYAWDENGNMQQQTGQVFVHIEVSARYDLRETQEKDRVDHSRFVSAKRD